MASHSHTNRAIASGSPLVHHRARHDAMQFEYLGLGHGAALRVLFDKTQTRKIIGHFPLRTRSRRWYLPSLFNRAHLLECERIALDCSGGMRIADTRVLLQRRDPGHLHRGCGNPLMQRRNLLDLAEQTRGNSVNRPVLHEQLVKHKSSYESSQQSHDWSSVSQFLSKQSQAE